jgi:hypothetical protein
MINLCDLKNFKFTASFDLHFVAYLYQNGIYFYSFIYVVILGLSDEIIHDSDYNFK